jgi:hypothetical protein
MSISQQSAVTLTRAQRDGVRNAVDSLFNSDVLDDGIAKLMEEVGRIGDALVRDGDERTADIDMGMVTVAAVVAAATRRAA